MRTTLKARHGTPISSDHDVIAEVEVLQRNADGTSQLRKMRMWVDTARPYLLRFNADTEVRIVPGGVGGNDFSVELVPGHGGVF